MKEKWDNKESGALFRVLAQIRSPKEARRFLRDLLTPNEIMEFGRRWKSAQLLDKGVAYKEVEKVTGLSSATVARVSRWLKNGMGGYRLMLDRTHHHSRSFVGRG